MDLQTGIKDVSLKIELEGTWTSNRWRLGAFSTWHIFFPSYLQLKSESEIEGIDEIRFLGERRLPSFEQSAFFEDEWSFGSFKLHAGLVGVAYLIRQSWLNSLQPRISLSWSPNSQLLFSAAYGENTQFLHLLSNSSLGLPTDIWVPATDRVPAQNSQQLSFSISWQQADVWSLNFDAYVKRFSDLATYEEGANLLTAADDWENRLALDGEGDAWGVELWVKKNKGRIYRLAFLFLCLFGSAI